MAINAVPSFAERVKTPRRVADSVHSEDDATNGNGGASADGEQDEDVLNVAAKEVDARILPHDRCKMLISDEGPTELYLSSARRWVAALLADEGVYEPIEARSRTAKAEIRTKAAGRLAGLNAADLLIREWMPGAVFSWSAAEGSEVDSGQSILTIEACRHQMLTCERTILNLLGRLSGIATNTARWAVASQIPVAATRKTAWGVLDKAAVAVGGGLTHRLSRTDALMLKENDLASTSVHGERGALLVRNTLRDLPLETAGPFVTVEVRSLDEALAAAETWAERMLETGEDIRLNIMLDNMNPELTKDAVLDLQTRGLREYVTLEASGGIEFESLESWQGTGVDVLSSSALHRATMPLDMTCIFHGA